MSRADPSFFSSARTGLWICIGALLLAVWFSGFLTLFGIIFFLIIGGSITLVIYEAIVNRRFSGVWQAIRAYFRSRVGRIKFFLTVIGGLALLLASLTVPQRAERSFTINDMGLEVGPDSNFRHIYDPGDLLGWMGVSETDRGLDVFQQDSGNIIIFAAFEATPSADPWFTLRVAELWAPGQKLDDRGLVIFLFMKERRIRAEIGYGYEEDLTDIRMGHILEQTMVPLLREGKPAEAVEAAARELRQTLEHRKGAFQGKMSFADKWQVFRLEITRKALFAVRIWRGNALRERLIISAAALVLWAWLVHTIVGLVDSMIICARNLRQSTRDESIREKHTKKKHSIKPVLLKPVFDFTVTLGLLWMVLTVGEHLGKGKFGGGGVDIFW